jgi:NTE family protein
MNNQANNTIGLALSGGGMRAAVFHIGVLRWLAENNKMENIRHLSSVSGGTLIIGLIFHLNDYKWPSSYSYITSVYPKLKEVLTLTDLQSALIKKSCNPINWIYISSRANILAKAIESCWGIKGKLSDLEQSPIWSANGTTFENGRRFRFKQNFCGDYDLGYASSANFMVADAMAVSAAFPYLIGPLVINSTDLEWKKRKNWNDAIDQAEIIRQPFRNLHFYDGGLYDNLGIEPLFDIGTQKIKDENISMLFVSDAGFPFQKKSVPRNPKQLKRVIDIMSDQSRSLRIRAISNYFKNTKNSGHYFQIGSVPITKIQQYNSVNEEMFKNLLLQTWLDASSINQVANYPTNLKKVTVNNFDLIERHGYETAKWNSSIFGNT